MSLLRGLRPWYACTWLPWGGQCFRGCCAPSLAVSFPALPVKLPLSVSCCSTPGIADRLLRNGLGANHFTSDAVQGGPLGSELSPFLVIPGKLGSLRFSLLFLYRAQLPLNCLPPESPQFLRVSLSLQLAHALS